MPDDQSEADEIALRVRLAESERARVAAETTVEAMRSSLSWRLTAPLRQAADRARAERARRRLLP